MSDKTKHTLGDTLNKLVLESKNLEGFLLKMNQLFSTKSDSVQFEHTKEDGTVSTYTTPSFGYLKGQINELTEQFNTLLSANSDVVGIKLANGQTRKFELKKISTLISDLEKIQNSEIVIPNEFRVKNNWFFESFLNPLLFVSLDISTLVTDDIDSFSVKRVIINSNDDDQLSFFDNNIKGKSDLELADITTVLQDAGIAYFEDDNLVDLPVGINRYRGTFDILKIHEEEISDPLNTGLTVIRKKYKLNTLLYTDVFDGIQNSKQLAVGDILITAGDSEYQIISVNKSDYTVILERKFGIDSIFGGADILRIKPVSYRVPELQVNVGYNERQIIFIRPISKKINLTTDKYSKGFSIYTNDLTIILQDGSSTTLDIFYNNFVSDFGLVFLHFAKERKLPATVGLIPNVPILQNNSFTVVQVDTHIKEDINLQNIKDKLSTKEKLSSEINESNKKIEKLKGQLNNKGTTINLAERNRLKTEIDLQAKNKQNTTSQLSTIVKDLSLNISTVPQFIVDAQYRVRGYWNMPAAIDSKYGKQNIIQFKVEYRYLSKKGTSPNPTQLPIANSDGADLTAFFSPWKQVSTPLRKKEYNDATGLFDYADEDISNPDVVNSNSIEIPIRKGEIVEIRVKSVSEAGWPENPLESKWSDTIQVVFPEEFESQEEGKILSQKIFADESRITFQEELNARGLDLHLLNAFVVGDKYISHLASDIASGDFTPEGNIINLQQKLTSLQTDIDAILKSIKEQKGVLKVTIYDRDGNTIEVKNGQTVELFAGYYKDLIKDTSSGTVIYNEGRIITSQYIISIENTSQTVLELVSTLFGGIEQAADSSNPIVNPTVDYHVNRRYDIVPISVVDNLTATTLGHIKQIPSLQSSQVKSQYLFVRYSNYGLSNSLYSGNFANNASYNWRGQTVNSQLVPYNYGHYLPFDPTFASTFSTNANVWNGTKDLSNNVLGNGYISTFCIHKDHPELTSLVSAYNINTGTQKRDLFQPKFEEVGGFITGKQQNYKFAHALHFSTSSNEKVNVFGVEHYKQASYVKPNTISTLLNSSRNDTNYPIKLGFVNNDEFLIGKYTCGSYLFIFPQSYDILSVEGNHPTLSKRKVDYGPTNAINIPLVFQFRCSDKLGNIGGYRPSEVLKNITYSKQIGIDIYLKNDGPFSFDVKTTCSYQKETTLDAPIVPTKGKLIVNF